MTVIGVQSFPPDRLVDELEARGLAARLSVEGCESGPDCRLRVRAPDRAVRVDLLCPLPGLLDQLRWKAVRVSGHDRAVWAGPPRPCDNEQLSRFLHELTSFPPAQLAGRWQRIG